MFSIIKNGTNTGIQTGIMCHYSVNHGAISIYYDKADEFNASLDMLLDDKNNFCSLTFTFHNKTNVRQPINTVLMSILKIDENAICFRLSNNSDKFLCTRISEADAIITEFRKQCGDICIYRARSDAYLSNDDLMSQSRKLLLHITTLAKRTLEALQENKVPVNIFEKLNLILTAEVTEFKSIIEANEVTSSSSNIIDPLKPKFKSF